MNPLGETVAALRAANGWTLQDLAANIRRCGAVKVQHQHLQQLESKPHTRPRYLIELAAAFGKSVEDLRSWQPGMPTTGANSTGESMLREPLAHYAVNDIRLSADELHLVESYRTCAPATREAIMIILDAARERKRGTRSNVTYLNR